MRNAFSAAESEPTGPALARARFAQGRRRFQLLRARERLRAKFWVIPVLSIAVAAGLAYGMTRLDEVVAVSPEDAPWWASSASAAVQVLTVMATAMLTFVGVVFSLSLVALQLASAQLSPRVLRTFVRSVITKVALGIFLATFVYSLIRLGAAAQVSQGVPVAGTTVALALVAASLVVFVVYVGSTLRLMQVSQVISSVAHETRQAIEANYPTADAYTVARLPDLSTPGRVVRGAHNAGTIGVLETVDVSALVHLARAHDCVVSLLIRVGDYVPSGAPVMEVHGTDAPAVRRLLSAVSFNTERTLLQDPAYGIRQLVDIAAQALSPALNQPTTAVQAIDRVEDLLLRIAERPEPSGLYVDEERRVRVVLDEPTWARMVDLSFTEICAFGASSPQVTRRLLAAFERLLASVGPERHGPLEDLRRELQGSISGGTGFHHLRSRPDSMGLG